MVGQVKYKLPMIDAPQYASPSGSVLGAHIP
jgi:hypothetical protein